MVLEKAEEPEIKLPTSTGSLKKQESSRETPISALLTMPKPLTVWITINCGKFLKRWEYQPIPFSIRVFSNESTLRMRWPKYWSFSFSISPSNEHSGLISFRTDWLDLPEVQVTQESSPTPQFKSINSLALSFLHSPTLTSIHDHWKKHSFD